MIDIDKRLLLINTYLKTHPYHRGEISKLLSITERQMTRLLKKWAEEGFIEYEGGIGRGNTSDIKFLIDIEQAYLNMVIRNLPKLSIEEINDLKHLPLSDTSIKLLESAIDALIYKQPIGNNEKPDEMLIDSIPVIPVNYHPLHEEEGADVIIFNVMDRLYEREDDGFFSHIIAYEEWQENEVVIQLRTDIKYSNGQLLFASDVVTALNRLIHHDQFKKLYSSIQVVAQLNTFTLRIMFDGTKAYIKELLSAPAASLYKEKEGKLITTGLYVVEKQEEHYVKLVHGHTLHHHVADIKVIYLVNSTELINDKHKDQLLVRLKPDHEASSNVNIHYKNVTFNSFGVIDYGKIVIDAWHE